MTLKIRAFETLIVVLVVALVAPVAGAMDATTPPQKKAAALALQTYLKRIEPTLVQANSARGDLFRQVGVYSGMTGITGLIPKMEAVIAACDAMTPVEDTLLNVAVPAPLRIDHRKMLRAFDRLTQTCDATTGEARQKIDAWQAAVDVFNATPTAPYIPKIEASTALIEATNALTQFGHDRVIPLGSTSYIEPGLDWRFTVTQYGGSLKVKLPPWVRLVGR
jgi:hypothetical protein